MSRLIDWAVFAALITVSVDVYTRGEPTIAALTAVLAVVALLR